MAKVKITGHASGSGVITVTAPNTSTDRTITLPDATGTLLNSDGDGSSLTGVGVDGIVSNANATAITIDSAENVGIGTTPESWHDSLTAVQIGETGSISGGDTAWGGYLEVGSNFYRDSGGFKRTSTDFACLAEFDNATGSIVFKSAASGSADAAISWTNQLQIKNDGRGLSPFTAKAWAYWDGTGTLDIRAAHNISSVSDYGTGWYAPTYANAMSGTSYGVYASGSFNNANRSRSVSGRVQNAGSAEVFSQADNTAIDNADCYVLIFSESTS